MGALHEAILSGAGEAAVQALLESRLESAAAFDGGGKLPLQRALAALAAHSPPTCAEVRVILLLEAATPRFHRALTRRVAQLLLGLRDGPAAGAAAQPQQQACALASIVRGAERPLQCAALLAALFRRVSRAWPTHADADAAEALARDWECRAVAMLCKLPSGVGGCCEEGGETAAQRSVGFGSARRMQRLLAPAQPLGPLRLALGAPLPLLLACSPVERWLGQQWYGEVQEEDDNDAGSRRRDDHHHHLSSPTEHQDAVTALHEWLAAGVLGVHSPAVHGAFLALVQLAVAADCGLLSRLPGGAAAASCGAAATAAAAAAGGSGRSCPHGWGAASALMRRSWRRRSGFQRTMTTPVAHFITKQCCLVLMLVLFQLAFSSGTNSSVSAAAAHAVASSAQSFTTSALFYAFVCGHMYGEVREAKSHGGGGGGGSMIEHSYAADVFNWVDMAIGACFSLEFVLRHVVGVGPQRVAANVADVAVIVGAVALWVRLLDALNVHPRIGPLVQTIVRMMGDMLQFLLVFGIVLAAFASAFVLRFGRLEPFSTPGRAVLTLFSASLGDFDLGVFDGRDRHAELLSTFEVVLGRTLLVTFVLFASVLLLNLLIAMLANSYSEIQQRARLEYQLGWARLVLHHQRMVRQADLPTPLNLVQLAAGQLAKGWRCCCARERFALRSTALAEALQLLVFWPPLFVVLCALWLLVLPLLLFYACRCAVRYAAAGFAPTPAGIYAAALRLAGAVLVLPACSVGFFVAQLLLFARAVVVAAASIVLACVRRCACRRRRSSSVHPLRSSAGADDDEVRLQREEAACKTAEQGEEAAVSCGAPTPTAVILSGRDGCSDCDGHNAYGMQHLVSRLDSLETVMLGMMQRVHAPVARVAAQQGSVTAPGQQVRLLKAYNV